MYTCMYLYMYMHVCAQCTYHLYVYMYFFNIRIGLSHFILCYAISIVNMHSCMCMNYRDTGEFPLVWDGFTDTNVYVLVTLATVNERRLRRLFSDVKIAISHLCLLPFHYTPTMLTPIPIRVRTCMLYVLHYEW